MLDNLPQDQTFTQLIITQMVTYYDQCFGLCKGTSSMIPAVSIVADTAKR